MLLNELFTRPLAEAKGIFGRNPGDPFVGPGEETAEFVQVVALPEFSDDGGGAIAGQYESPEARDQAIAAFEKDNNTQITWVNAPNSGSLAFGIAQLRTSDGKDMFWGRYLKQVGPNLMSLWSNSQIPAGWKLQTKGAKKLDAGLEPQHLIKTESHFQGATQVISTVERNASADDKEILVNALKQAANGQLPVFPGQLSNLEVLRDYFGEIMGPVAMMGGAVGGDVELARQELAGGAEWNNLKIFWPQSMNYNLVDSIFIAPDGKEIGISSKGGKGAAASAKNLYDSLQKNSANKELMNNTKFIAEIVTIIQEQPADTAPFTLGEKFGLITPALKAEAYNAIKTGKVTFDNLSDEATKITSGINWQSSVQGFNVGYAIVASVARAVASHVNQNPKFSNQAIALLNTASIIQLYTKMGKNGNDVRVNGFDALYPPNFQGNVALDGSKNYYSSRIGGKFAFKFK